MRNIIRTNGRFSGTLMISLLIFMIFSCMSQNIRIYASEGTEGKVLAPEHYYHLDMGVQLVYFDGVTWENGYEYGTSSRNVNTSILFNEGVLVNDVYPLESSKGQERYDFGSGASSNNIPKGLGSEEEAYDNYYKLYSSNLITVDGYSGDGNEVNFNYRVMLGTPAPLEVVEYGELGRAEYIYSLFGSEIQLQRNQPEIYESVRLALEQGANGTAGKSKLYLVFCPNVIEYQKYVEYGQLKADLNLPTLVRQGQFYDVKDASLIDDGIIVEKAVLEKSATQLGLTGTSGTVPVGEWQPVATWFGSQPGANTGGMVKEEAAEIGSVNYRLSVTGDNGQVDQVIKTLQINDGREIQGDANLNLQAVTYEGHSAWAIDESTFVVDGENYSAARAYDENAATNSFIPQSGSGGIALRENATEATVTFPVRGTYHVDLKIALANNSTLVDTKQIEVKKTPGISDSLGGVQKQNRRQVITAAVATSPGSPLTDYYIEVTDMVTGEKVTLTKEEPQKNNGEIKTRKVKIEGGESQLDPNDNDPCWTIFTLEFLTKTPAYIPEMGNQGQQFTYKIWVLDSKGDTDTVERTFQVFPDLAPETSIRMQDTFIREIGTDTAKIEMEDGTTTDGDQLERTWMVSGIPVERVNGFKDLSFQSRQHVQFEKTGIGQLEIRLNVKDKWIEPTLEEYVSEEDYKKGEAVRVTDVINIAPVVSLKPVQGKEAEVFILAAPENWQLFQMQLNSMKSRFLENGVVPEISIIGRAAEDAGGYRQIYCKSWKSAMWCPSVCRETGPIYDSNYLYTIQSNSIVAQNYTQKCDGTHTIYAESVDGTLPSWNYTVNQAESFFIKLDNKEKYVYVIFRNLDQTILLNRSTGAEVGRIPLSLNGEIFLNEKNEIFVADEFQIAKYNSGAQLLEKVGPGGRLIKMLEGKIGFVGKDSADKTGNRFYLGLYDMNQGILTGKALPEMPTAEIKWTTGNKSEITPVDMDLNGKVIFKQTYYSCTHDTVQNASIWIADSSTQKVKCASMIAPMTSSGHCLEGLSTGFVTDATGEGKYAYVSYYENEDRTPTTVRWTFKLFDMKMGTGLPVTQVMSTGRQTNTYNFSGISYAKIHENENKLYILRGNAFQSSNWGGVQPGERMSISLPSFSKGATVDQWDMADEYATENAFLSATYYFYEQWINPENRVKIFKNAITSSQAIEYAIKKNITDRDGEKTYILEDLNPVQEEINTAIDGVCRQVEEKLNNKTGIELEKAEAVMKNVQLKRDTQYLFEYDVYTSSGSVSKVFWPYESDDENQIQPTPGCYKEVAAQVDFTRPGALEKNTFYTCSTSCYLEGRGGYGSGYYGKSGQSRNYSITVGQTMEKEGYTEFDMFSYFGNQVSGSWSIVVDGKLYETRQGGMDEHMTLFLGAGEHRITISGSISSGYSGYIGLSNIQTVYYKYYSGSALKEKFSVSDGWNQGSGNFKPPAAALFNMTEDIRTDILKETFAGNTVNLNKYLSFSDNVTCPWTYNGGSGYASMASTYSTSAVGSFNITAPENKHLIVAFDEMVSIERQPTTTLLPGGSKMIGGNTFFVASGQTLSRNYSLQRGRNGGTGSVKIRNIKIVEIPATISGDSIFGIDGAASLNISARTAPFYLFGFILPEGSLYSWKTFDSLAAEGAIESRTISLLPQGMTDGAASLIKNFRFYEKMGNVKLLALKQNFENRETVAADQWTALPGAEEIKITTLENQRPEEPSMVYKKGQLVAFNIGYRDYENDPSRRQYWKYYHTPMNDGAHPGATQLGPDGTVSAPGPIFGEPIQRFYIDGKYTVEHWQEDNTARTPLPLDDAGYPAGNPDYDKLSNVETVTFYIQGTSEAPWIESIETGASQPGPGGTTASFTPSNVKEGDAFTIRIKVDDLEKDILNLKTEVYRDGKFLYKHYKEGIQADGGTYPSVITDTVGLAIAGKYQIVCTVRDDTGAGIGSLMFTVLAEGKITGNVIHTEAWDANRNEYNSKHPGAERNGSTFWPGETFVLKAAVAGSPSCVTVEILECLDSYGRAKYGAVMSTKRLKNEKGEFLYEGEIWDKAMIKTWSKQGPLVLTFRFASIYGASQPGPDGTPEPGEGSKVKYDDVQVIVDDRVPYLMMHRVW